MRLKTKTEDRILAWGAYLGGTFLAPLLLAIPLIAIVAVLHGWWSTIPLMHYWTAYWLGVVTVGLGGGALLLMWLGVNKLLDR